MMKEFYSINELATITGFTTRSLRNFISMGHLCGEKIDGVWQFTVEKVVNFLKNPNVAPGIKSKNTSVVLDFLSEEKKDNNEICTILDLKLSDDEANEMSEFFCEKVNKYGCGKFKFAKTGGNCRFIISGPEDFVVDVIKGWYN